MSKFIWFCKEKEIPKQKKRVASVDQLKKHFPWLITGKSGTTHDMIE